MKREAADHVMELEKKEDEQVRVLPTRCALPHNYSYYTPPHPSVITTPHLADIVTRNTLFTHHC